MTAPHMIVRALIVGAVTAYVGTIIAALASAVSLLANL